MIRDAKSLLKPGRNVLAIEGHNVSPDSSDFSLDPFLATRKLEVFSVADYLADIDELERRLLDQSSYLTRLGFDYQKAFDGPASLHQRRDTARSFCLRRAEAGDADRRLPRERSIGRRVADVGDSSRFARPTPRTASRR